MEIFVLSGLLLALAVASYLWGADSRERWNSPEWERRAERRHWL